MIRGYCALGGAEPMGKPPPRKPPPRPKGQRYKTCGCGKQLCNHVRECGNCGQKFGTGTYIWSDAKKERFKQQLKAHKKRPRQPVPAAEATSPAPAAAPAPTGLSAEEEEETALECVPRKRAKGKP